MSIKVQKYLANLGKSVAYTTADVLSEKFTYVKDFKNENQEVFKEAYHSIKDYRTTYARIKKTITDNKIMDAARVGFDSIVYSVTTGDFYAKNKEQEVVNKYGGNFMQGMDIDDDDFDFSNEDVTDGDKVIATAVKKNSKLQTAITTEAIVKTGKAQMDVSKENTMLLYTQNERLINKLDGGFQNITGFLKQNAEQTAKVQNQMNENLNKFMANVDNNVAKLTKQMDELLEMQRNLYAKQTEDPNKKKKPGYDDIIGRGGVINIKEYGKYIARNAGNELMNTIPGLSMILGDGGIEGANLLATMLANPTRELSKTVVNKALGKGFDRAAKALNKTLENLVPSLIAKANAAGKKEDAGLAGLLGKILGIKTGSNESVDPNKYVKGTIPFDGITKKAIIDVIPYYLRKMTSAMTGGEEMTFDYATGRWTSMKSAKKAYDNVTTSAQRSTESLIKNTIQAGTNRSFESMYATIEDYDRANSAVQRLALKLQAAGDFGSLRESDLDSAEKAIYTSMKKIFQRSERLRYEKDDNGRLKMRKGFSGPDIAAVDGQLLDIIRSQNNAIKQLNEQGGIAMLAAMEGITGDAKSYHGKSYVDAKGDMNERHVQEMPTAQVLLRAKDEYGITLYQYLRSMGHSLNYIKRYSTYLETLPFINNGLNPNPPSNGGGNPSGTPPTLDIPTTDDGFVDYGNNTKDDKYASRYYEQLETDARRKAKDKFEDNIKKVKEHARKKGRSVNFITDSYNYQSEGDQIGISRLVSDYYGEGGEYETEFKPNQRKEEEKKEKEKWKKMEELIGRESTDKLRKATDKYDKDKGLMENLSKATGTTEKLAIAAKWFTEKTNFAVMDKVTNTIVKTDAWLRNLIYGEGLKADEQKKSLWELIKGHTSDFFKSIKKQIGELLSPVKKYYDEKIKPHVDKVKKKIFGDVDSEGNILEEGLLSHFTAGFRKGMARNRDDVHAMWRNEIEAARRLGDRITNPESSSINSSSTSNPSPQPEQLIENPRQAKQRRKIDSQIRTIYQLRQKISTQKQYINEIKGYIQDANDNITSLKYYGADINDPQKYLEAVREKQAYESELRNAENELKKLNNALKNAKKKYDSLVAEANAMGMRNIDSLATMAAGGVNRTGHSFQSVLSAGEYLNGSKISQTGIYTIPKGGVVYNPAPASVRNIQARNEKNFIRGLRYNAEADDGLTTEELAQHQQLDAEARERIRQVDINKLTNWTTLEDGKQRAAFLGNMASRGALGGIAGLLVGGPLLGAAVGAASTLTKSTDSFASFLFGDVEKDKETGEIIIDNTTGNPKRKDNGLISKELQKAAPDMAKGGMAGMAASLLTPLGPLGGLLIGTGLGFAKNSEIFQGSLFGEGGIFSNKNVDKLKKGAKNMGIGAATAALFLPGPFGLVGSALIGATAGYATSTDKFKDFLLGKEDEDGKRRGGVRGALEDNIVRPFKGFGQTIIDKTMDEIFGKKDGDGEDAKRKGGLFGAIRENVITPMTSGAQSIFKEITNTMDDIKDFTLDIMKKIRANAAGNDFLGGVWEKAGKIGSGAIGLAGKAGRLATKPFRLLGDEGIGGRLKAKRIRSGRADDMTARERKMYRGRLHMAAEDEWSDTDETLANMSAYDLDTLNTLLDYDSVGGDIEKLKNNAYITLGQELRKNIDRKDSRRIIKMIKEGRHKDVERWLNTRNYDDATKKSVMKELNIHKNKMTEAQNAIDDMENSGVSVQQYLLSKGINIDISNEKKRKNLKKMTMREIAHQGAGLTDEEVEFEREKAFWNGKDSPFNTVNNAAVNMEKLLESIHYDLTIGSNYDKLSAEERAKYGSRAEYINSIKNSRANAAIRNAANGGEFSIDSSVSKIGRINRGSIKAGDFISNDIYNDYLQFYMGNLKNTISADDRIHNLVDDKLNELIDMACQMFDGLAMKELCVTARVQDDINLKIQQIMRKENCDEDTAKSKIKYLTRKMTVVRNDKNYEFTMAYSIGSDGKTIKPTERQLASYNSAKRQFVDDYVADHRPVSAESSHMSVSEMLGNSIKYGVYLTPSFLPLPLKDFVRKHAKGIISAAIKGVKKIGFEAGMLLGSHEINDKSIIQRANNYRYQLEAENEWKKEVNSYFTAFRKINSARSKAKRKELEASEGDKLLLLDSITKELDIGVSQFGLGLSDEEREQVHQKFISKYIEAKKNNQIFGRGLLGNIKHAGSKLGNGVAKVFKSVSNVLFKPASITAETKEDRKAALIETFKKKAEYYWKNSFFDEGDKKAKRKFRKARTLRLEIAEKLYHGKAWRFLTESEIETIKTDFINQFSEKRFRETVYGEEDEWLIEKIGKRAINITKTAGAHISDWAKNKLEDAKEWSRQKAAKINKQKFIEFAIKNNDERLNDISVEIYDRPYNELTDDEKLNVENRFYAKYGYGKHGIMASIFMKSAIKKVVNSNIYKSVGTLKSGIRNAAAGKLDAMRAKKEKNQEQDTLIGKFFDRMDARRLKKDREEHEGKRDSKIGKIIKWLFVGGIFVPLVVGFIKEDLLPAIREKVKPWLAKAKDKIFGVKNETTGEYEGGVISGIVNPIRKFFKSKFERVHNWIHNEGEYSAPDRGLSGFWNSLAKVGAHIVDLWKSGFASVYGDFVPKVLYAVGKNLIPMTWEIVKNIGKGLIDYAKDVFKGKRGALKVEIPNTSSKETVNSASSTIDVPNTVGGTVRLESPGYSKDVDFKNEAISKGGNEITGTLNEDGTSTFENKGTGKKVTSKITGDYYSIGTNSAGQQLFKDNKTNKVYTPDSNGALIPLSEYNELMDESLSENEEYQRQVALENANELEADYTGHSGKRTAAGVIGRLAMRTGNMGLLNGAKGIKIMSTPGVARVLNVPFKILKHTPRIIPFTGPARMAGRLGEGLVNLAGKAAKPITAIHSVAMNNIGRVGDRVTGGAFSRIGQKVVDREVANAAKIAARNQERLLAGEYRIAKNANKLAAVTAENADGIIPKTIQFLKKSVLKIKGKILKVLQDRRIKKLLGKNAAKKANEIAENTSRGLTKALEDNVDEITKNASTVTAKGAAKVLSIVMIVADFLLGMDNCRNILGIITRKPSFIERLTGGLINIIPDVIMTLAEVVTGASFGAAGAIGAILAGLSIISTIIISVESIRNKVVGVIIDVLDNVPGIDMSKIKEKRAKADATIEAFNAKNNTNVNIEEYNNIMKNKTLTSKIGDGVKNAGSAVFGYDSGSKNAIIDKTSGADKKGKSEKVRKKLATVFSSIWQFYGERDFNPAAYDKDGNELGKKKRLNANKAKFNEVAAQIASELITSLVSDCTKDEIKEVASNVTDFTGVADANLHLKNVYKSKYEDPSRIFKGLDDDFLDYKRIKGIAGICAIMDEIFAPLSSEKVIDPILRIMIPAYFNSDKGKEAKIIKWGEGVDERRANRKAKRNATIYKYINVLNTISAIQQNKEKSEQDDSDETIDEQTIPTNANANDKLSPLTGNFDPLIKGLEKGFGWLKDNNPLEKMGIYFGNLINNSIKSLTGGFEGVEQFFKGLTSKNYSVNRGIDELSILPTDKNYWKIELDKKNPFMSGLFNFVESMNRVVKAPFALAAASLTAGMSNIQLSGSTTNNSNTATINNSGNKSTAASTVTTAASGLLQGVKNTASKLWNAFKGFGKGKDNSGNSGYGADPYHIYQRDYSGSYRTAGDSESQTIADSGCGPASAASVLRMYGKKGDMRNAVNYALSNKYKEVNGGTYPEYFNSYLNKNGIKTNSNANNADVVNSLAQGKPVILMGRDSQNSGRTPYGSKYSHYVVARGLDKNGNVIVEDSEDKRGSTRYSLADTLRNSTVRITTGRGYGRAKESLANRYVSGVSGVTAASIGNIMANTASALSGIKVVNGTAINTKTNNMTTASTNGVAGSITPDTDVKTKCGYTADQLKAAISSIHPGCSAEQFPEAAIAVEKSLGVNALFTCAVAIIEHGWDGNVGINTTGANWGNWNVFNIEGTPNSSNGRWKDYNSLTDSFEGFGKLITGSVYYGDGLTTPAKIGPRYCDSNWASGVCGVADTIVSHIGGSGRGKGMFSALTKKFFSNVKNTIAYTATNNVLKLLNGSSASSNVADNTDNINMVSGNVSAVLGKSLTMSDGKGNTHTIKITQDEVELYSMLTSECGLSPAAACGAIGNWEQECGINRIKEIATRGVIAYGGGIMQWTPGSKHTEWAESNGFGSNPWSWEANLAHAKEEIMTGGNWNNPKNASPSFESEGLTPVSSFDEFKVLTDPESAAANFERVYEVSGDWNGRNSEGVRYSENMIHDNLRRLNAKILYELIVNGKSGTNDDSSGSGRGVDNDKLSVTGRARRQSGYGRYGRAGEVNSGEIESQVNPTTSDVPVDTTKTEDTTNASGLISLMKDTAKIINSTTNIDKLNSKNTTTSNNTTNATGLISLMKKYTKAVTKGIFGDFYDALYGNEQEEAVANSNSSATYRGGDVIYAAAMVFEALYNADQNLTYDCNCVKYNDLVCRDGTVLEHERPDCSGMMSAVIHYMGYYTARWSSEKNYTDTYHGEGFGTQNWDGASSNTCIYDKDGNLSSDWEVLKFDPNDVQPGDIRFHSGHGHTDMYVFTNSQGNRFGFNAGSGDSGGSIGDGMYNSYCLAKYYLDNDNQLPDPDSCHGNRGEPGAWTIQDNECKLVLRYKGSGNGKFGRGSARNDKTDLTKLNRIPISKRKVTDSDTISNIVTRDVNRDLITGTYRTRYGRGTGPLKSLDDIRRNRTSSSNNTNTRNNTTISPHTGRGSITSAIDSTNAQYDGDNLANIIRLAAIIADNSNKIDDILTILAAIAVNTENTTNAIGNSNNKKTPNGSKNGLSALRAALNSNNSGEDIINAIYQIAKS